VAAQKPKQPWLNWADMLTGLAQVASGHRPEGMSTFQRVEGRGLYSKSDADKAMAEFFIETSQQMTSEHVIDPKTTKAPAGSAGPAAYLFFAMKDWDAGAVDEAADFFRRFRQSEFTGTDSWLEGLKPMATDYVEEYTAYQMASDAWKTAKTLDQKRSAVKQLKSVQGKLAPKAQELAVTASAEVAKLEKERAAMLAQGKIPDGRYRITNRKTGKALETEGHSHDDGHKVQTWGFNNGGNQQWHVIPQDNGTYMLINVEASKALSLPTNPTTLNRPSTSNNGKPTPTPTPTPKPDPKAPKPTPTPTPKPVTDDNTQAQQSNTNSKVPWQHWRIEKVEGNYFKITSQLDGKALTAKGQDNGAAVVQAPYDNAQEQEWKIEGL
jgi:cell division septation protein DedD